MPQRLVIPANPLEKITLEFVGQEYLIKPPKASLGIVLAQKIEDAGDDTDALMDELKGWVVMVFGKKTAEKVLERMFDSEDELDLRHIVELITKLAEYVTGNPTTSSPD